MIPDSLFKKVHTLFFYALIILLPTQLGYHFWPEWAMVLGRRVDYLSPTLYLTDVLIVLVLLFWAASWISGIRNRESRIMINTKRTVLASKTIIRNSLFIIPLLFIFTNIYFAVSRPVAVYSWMKLLEFSLLGVYIVKTRPEARKIVLALSVAVLYSSLLAIVQFVLRHSVGGPMWMLGERMFSESTPGIARADINFSLFTYHVSLFRLRPYATFPHPNVLGGFIAVSLPLFIASMCHRVRASKKITNSFLRQFNNLTIQQFGFLLERLEKPYLITVIASGLVALVLTFSRSAWAAGMVGILIVCRKQIVASKVRLALSVLAVLAACYFLFTTFSVNDESVVVRQQLNTSAVKIWQSSPLFGAGLGNFLVALPSHIPSRAVYFLQPVHNIYLLLLSEIGLVGIGIIAIIIYFYLNHESGIMNHEKTKKVSQTIIHYSLFIILFLGLVDHYPLSLQQGRLLLTILIGLLW
jgi:O-antigen ligase